MEKYLVKGYYKVSRHLTAFNILGVFDNFDEALDFRKKLSKLEHIHKYYMYTIEIGVL